MHPNNFLKILKFSIAISNEAMVGIDGIKNLEEYNDEHEFKMMYFSTSNGRSRNTNEEEVDNVPYIIQFVDKYFNSDNNYSFSNAIVRYVLRGVLDVNAFSKEVRKLFNDTIKPDIVQLLSMGQWYLLTDEEFISAVFELRRRVKEGELHLQAYPYQCLQLIHLMKKGFITDTLDELKEEILDGMEKSLTHSEYSMFWNIPYQVNHLNVHEMEFYTCVKNKATEFNEFLNMKNHECLVANIISNSEDNFDILLEKIYSKEGTITDSPFLTMLGVDFLYDKITTSTNEQVYRIRLHLEERYKYYRMDFSIKSERVTLNELSIRLREFVNNNTHSLKSVFIEEMCDHWDAFLDELERDGDNTENKASKSN